MVTQIFFYAMNLRNWIEIDIDIECITADKKKINKIKSTEEILRCIVSKFVKVSDELIISCENHKLKSDCLLRYLLFIWFFITDSCFCYHEKFSGFSCWIEFLARNLKERPKICLKIIWSGTFEIFNAELLWFWFRIGSRVTIGNYVQPSNLVPYPD